MPPLQSNIEEKWKENITGGNRNDDVKACRYCLAYIKIFVDQYEFCFYPYNFFITKTIQ